jgi:hypothetical protein
MEKLPLQSLLDNSGLNRHHVFNLNELPNDLLEPLAPTEAEKQLIIFGNAGRKLWECVKSRSMNTDNPIDEFSVNTLRTWFQRALPEASARFVFPIGLPPGKHVGLQRLGTLAGWHHPSPFFVGIDANFGSWFAYRAAVLTNTALQTSTIEDFGNPCLSCVSKPCISACPASAICEDGMDMMACHTQRLQESSACALGCLSRLACPVGAEYRYEMSQIRHSASGSLATIRNLFREVPPQSNQPESTVER